MIRNVPVSFAQLAKAALDLIGRVSVQADDDSLAITQGVRNMLHAIADGTLEVQAPKAEKKAEKEAK